MKAAALCQPHGLDAPKGGFHITQSLLGIGESRFGRNGLLNLVYYLGRHGR
jgi:hypothetical protein